MTLSVLQRVGTELARGGLIENAPWLEKRCAEAQTVFEDRNLQIAAIIVAAMHPYAVEYIQQAPVIVLGASQGHDLTRVDVRRQVAKKMRKCLEDGPKLRDLMGQVKMPYQLRKLFGAAWGHQHYSTAKHLAVVNASTLSQILPDYLGEQRRWIDSVAGWVGHMERRFNDPTLLLEWAARNVGDHVASVGVIDIADFAYANRATFNPRWTYDRARMEATKWHVELAEKSNEDQFQSRYGFGWRDQIDYAPYPNEIEIEGVRFVGIRSGADLFIEGQVMHHCVASYADAVVTGRSWIYSLQKDGQKIATAEFIIPRYAARYSTHLTELIGGKYAIICHQAKGPCNAAIPEYAKRAIVKFLEKVNRIHDGRIQDSMSA